MRTNNCGYINNPSIYKDAEVYEGNIWEDEEGDWYTHGDEDIDYDED